jgi:5-methylcytosine-specific restriction endonuclease McrA
LNRACLTCGRVIPGNRERCVDCQRARWRQRNYERPAFERQLYSSAAWRKLADAVVADADACTYCGTPTEKLTADHVETLRNRPDLALDPENVVAACRSCQERRKHRRGVGT